MQMYCQSPDYVVCPSNPIYPSDRPSPPPAQPLTPHTPHSAGFLPQFGHVYTDSLFVSNPPPSSSPSSSSGTLSSPESSPHLPPVEHFAGDDYSYPYVSFVEQQQPLFTPSGIETSTPPNEGPQFVFHHAQQHLYELYRPYKTEPSEYPLSQIPSHPYPTTFTPDYANSNQPVDYAYQTPCEQYPHYPSDRSSVDYNMLAEQNPDYIIGTSSIRYTASSPPEQGCVSPAMVSDGSPRDYVEVPELPPSSPAYDITPQANVCDPRAVSGFEEPEQRTSPNLPMKRSPSATPPPMFPLADQQLLEAGSVTPHVQQEPEAYSSGESELDREEYEDEKDTQTAVPSEQPKSTVLEAESHADPSSASEPVSMPTPAPANSSTELAHETKVPLTIIVPARPKRRRGQAVPTPVPNLTKKSRGRSVPTVPDLIVPYGAYKPRRSFVCVVTDCRKCFARGEHLKRHVRSIHTNEKPFLCTFPECDKAFSRYDNLGQHMRIHRHHQR